MDRSDNNRREDFTAGELREDLIGSKVEAISDDQLSENLEHESCNGVWQRKKDRPDGKKLIDQAVAYSSSCAPNIVKGQTGIRRCLVSSFKGFLIGAGLKGGLALFNLLLQFQRKLRSKRAKSPGRLGKSALKETLQYGLFLGAFSGVYTSIDEALAAFLGRNRGIKWRTFLAGAMAGPSLLLTGLDTQHTSLAVYIFMRGAVLASRCGIKSEKFGSLCKPLTWRYGDIFLMCISSSQILSSHTLRPDTLPTYYRSFLLKHGDKNELICEAIKELAIGKGFTTLDALERYYKSKSMDVKLDPSMKLPCSIVHGNQSCTGHSISFFFNALGRSLPVYLPIYFIPALIVHRHTLLKRPFTILTKSFMGTARSTLFLSVYTATGWLWPCMIMRMMGRTNIPLVVLSTFPSGIALLVEKKSRRMEIALFCFARALESFFRTFADLKIFSPAKKLKRLDVILFSLSAAIIMHCYATEREVFRSKYLNVLDWVFGVPDSIEPLQEDAESKQPVQESSRKKTCE